VQRCDLQLLTLSFGTGFVDAMTIFTLFVFCCNETGNVVFLGLSALGLEGEFIHADRSVVSLVGFWAGAFIFGQIGHRIGPRRRWWLILSLALQASLETLAVILLWTNVMRVDDNTSLAFICMLAFAFGGQGAVCRPLGVPEVPTVVVTSAFIDLFADKDFFKLHNVGRNRRLAFCLLLFLGALLSSVCIRFYNYFLPILIAALIKYVVAASFLLNRRKR